MWLNEEARIAKLLILTSSPGTTAEVSGDKCTHLNIIDPIKPNNGDSGLYNIKPALASSIPAMKVTF